MTDAASVEGDVRIRLFCALRLPDETVDALVEWQTLLPDGPFRPVAPDNLHVTLAFLGHRPRGDVESIAAALEAAAQAARDAQAEAEKAQRPGGVSRGLQGGAPPALPGDPPPAAS